MITQIRKGRQARDCWDPNRYEQYEQLDCTESLNRTKIVYEQLRV